jgi:hypothetical protein
MVRVEMSPKPDVTFGAVTFLMDCGETDTGTSGYLERPMAIRAVFCLCHFQQVYFAKRGSSLAMHTAERYKIFSLPMYSSWACLV